MDKTFAELGYNVGDTVRCVDGGSGYYYETGKEYSIGHTNGEPSIKRVYNGYSASWELVSRAGSTDAADDGYLIWGDMTPEAQGALLLAEHNGEIIQGWHLLGTWVNIPIKLIWRNHMKYRVKPANPVVVTHELFGINKGAWSNCQVKDDTHKISYNTIDGVIDCASVQMVEIEKP